jgi:DTW domain-containing protein YfiP
MKLFLLTHQKELHRKTNTGSLALEYLGEEAEVILWERTKPNKKLLTCIEEGGVALLYPHEQSEVLCEITPYNTYILIDSTWQEAQKIYNQSPYLHTLPCVKVQTDKSSVYSLRRNQKASGLCTAEIVAEVLRSKSRFDLAENLLGALDDFM